MNLLSDTKIRYRAKNKNTDEIIQVILPIINIETGCYVPGKDIFNPALWEIISRDMYIGLDDRMNIEIYENDIVMKLNGETGIVKYDKNSCSFQIDTGDKYGSFIIIGFNKTLEIVGNQYDGVKNLYS